MITTLSGKYQVVIPKSIRRKHGLQPGQKMEITETATGQIMVKPASLVPMTHQDVIDKYAGSVKNNPWGKDPVARIRKLREEWDR